MDNRGSDLPSLYDPKGVEDEIYRLWEEGGYFAPPDRDRDEETFTIVIPPPNVTGELHMGHALNNSIQDILIRFNRMRGRATLWIPGSDHAGIATQHVVEKHLLDEGTSRHHLGREAFVERVWEWKEHYEARIMGQLRRLGASADWTRTRFTMDPSYSRAVREVFAHLYERGLIYRGDYLINWCTVCGTALSDLEVEHQDSDGLLYYIRYPAPGGDVLVATTRPETMLGDTAVAVHPDDPRYQDLVGKSCTLPILERSLPIIADSWVDPEFGTGAVKVTPGHDPNDYEMGIRHGLAVIRVIDETGKMTEEAGPYQDLDRAECRKRLVRDLQEAGYLLRTEAHRHAVGHCYRCDSTVEPLVSRQWFVKMDPLTARAIKTVKDGDVKFVPGRFERVYMHWMENIRDWCISRQLWWGHRIPAWTCTECGEMMVCREDPELCQCGSEQLVQDPDVLDTWFSSALWPFATMGWPDQTEDLERFFPTDILVTGYDIIFFWVARMIFSALEFTDQRPFHTVLLNGLVRAEDGRKMSKSLGTGVDPLELVDQYGADALRFALIAGAAPGNDMRLRNEKIQGGRNFANKLWNASRFLLMNLDDYQGTTPGEPVDIADRWITSRLSVVTAAVTDRIEKSEMGEAVLAIYDFLWSEFCDWYLEMAKARLDGPERESVQHTLVHVFESALRLLHPFMPFVTEYLWQRLPGPARPGEALMTRKWPQAEPRDSEAEWGMEVVMDVVRAIRNLRADLGLAPGKTTPVLLRADERSRGPLTETRGYVAHLARAEPLTVGGEELYVTARAVVSVAGTVEIFIPWEGLIDPQHERQRLAGELGGVEQELKRSERKLSNEGFRHKAPAEVVAREEQRLASHRQEAERLRRLLEQIG